MCTIFNNTRAVAHIHSLFWHSGTHTHIHTHTHSPPATPPQLTAFLSLRPSTSGIVQEASWKPLPLAPEHSQIHCLKRKTRLFTFCLSSQTISLAFSAVILVCWCWCAAVCYFCSLLFGSCALHVQLSTEVLALSWQGAQINIHNCPSPQSMCMCD